MTIHDSDYRPRGPKLTGRRTLMLFAGFFIVVFGMNGLMVFQALSTFDGVEVEGAYQKGRAYNHLLARMEAQEKLGWKAAIDVAPASNGDTALTVTFTDAAGAPLEGLAVHGTFWRPVAAGEDRRMSLTETAPGIYTAVFALAHSGNWLVRISGTGPQGETFTEEQRVFVRG
ncbi:FixH family protein [Parvibaculum lavamentivorans DS-1]|uniref:FixH family protein n=1 Tax=Parvibaculum lavamentivorans (strain DS-1 / DSM 13023 / NCIMB 13966) TaxID=402881 RepID=A7HTB3_PARL1|nr:FixH family protein [Parvibaculum lavamentivorans]ABS63146.1 FixH family protein [Parvibaculum lavamentivorans DS-1]